MSSELDELYREILMEHYRFPRGDHDIENADIENEGHNPLCGDEVDIKLKVNNDKIDKISRETLGTSSYELRYALGAVRCHGHEIELSLMKKGTR